MQLSESDCKRVFDIVKQKYEQNGHINRFNHITGVAKMATYLANKYGIDPVKAYISGMVHDYYKYESTAEMASIINDEDDIKECEEYPFLYHAHASAKALKKVFNIDDIDIYNAVYNHVFGRLNMSMLEKIVMISDYTEENRKYEQCISCRKILLEEGIDKAIYVSLLNTIDHVTKLGEKPHPLQLKILEEYKEKLK